MPSAPQDVFQPVDPKAAAERLSAVADKLAQAGVEVRFDIADVGLAMIAQGGDQKDQPSEVVPLPQIFNHRRDELAAAADRLIAKVKGGYAQTAV